MQAMYQTWKRSLWYWRYWLLSFHILTDFGRDRFTFGFTLKDSPDFCINVSSWGNEEYINGLCGSFRIGDCGKSLYSDPMHSHVSSFVNSYTRSDLFCSLVVIDNPLVTPKDPEKEERFCPATPRSLHCNSLHMKLNEITDLCHFYFYFQSSLNVKFVNTADQRQKLSF